MIGIPYDETRKGGSHADPGRDFARSGSAGASPGLLAAQRLASCFVALSSETGAGRSPPARRPCDDSVCSVVQDRISNALAIRAYCSVLSYASYMRTARLRPDHAKDSC